MKVDRRQPQIFVAKNDINEGDIIIVDKRITTVPRGMIEDVIEGPKVVPLMKKVESGLNDVISAFESGKIRNGNESWFEMNLDRMNSLIAETERVLEEHDKKGDIA
jgi:hypothetical protein